jgi:alpha-glucosidase
MHYTGEKPVDPLIFNVWPLTPGSSSSYSVYEDSGVSVEYQRGVFARTPIKATQTGDTLRVEIGPVEGGYPGMPKTRGFELRLPADWPPASVLANGKAVQRAGPTGKGGWRFEGNTLTTIIPVAAGGVETKATIEVRRAAGLTAKRGELDGFAGSMARLRGSYDALNQTGISTPPDALVDAMQSGDRLGYHPERATEEIAHFRDVLPKAQAAVAKVDAGFKQWAEDDAKRQAESSWRAIGVDLEAQKQHRLEAMTKAQRQATEAGK